MSRPLSSITTVILLLSTAALPCWAEPVVPGCTFEVYASKLNRPIGMAFDEIGGLYVGSDCDECRIYYVGADGDDPTGGHGGDVGASQPSSGFRVGVRFDRKDGKHAASSPI